MTGWPAGQIPVKAIAEAVLERARRTGLIWRLRPATVTTVAGDGTIRVRLDGDTEPIRVASMVGSVAVAARVMVLITPPSGNHIVGWAGTPAPGSGPAALAWADTDSAPVTETQAVLSAPVILRARTAYRVELGGGTASSTGAVGAYFRLRRAACGGQQAQPLAAFPCHSTDSAMLALDGTACYLRRDADTDLDTVIELTLETDSGTVTHTAPDGRCRYLQLTACGEAARFPHAIAVT